MSEPEKRLALRILNKEEKKQTRTNMRESRKKAREYLDRRRQGKDFEQNLRESEPLPEASDSATLAEPAAIELKAPRDKAVPTDGSAPPSWPESEEEFRQELAGEGPKYPELRKKAFRDAVALPTQKEREKGNRAWRKEESVLPAEIEETLEEAPNIKEVTEKIPEFKPTELQAKDAPSMKSHRDAVRKRSVQNLLGTQKLGVGAGTSTGTVTPSKKKTSKDKARRTLDEMWRR